MKNEDRVIMTTEVKDRLIYAQELVRGKRVLDVGGAGMPACDKAEVHNVPGGGKASTPPDQSPFALAYREIRNLSREYRVVDQPQPDKQLLIDYPLDLNRAEAVAALGKALDEYRPEVILCMETLEHVNHHFEVMNHFARCVERDGAQVFISLAQQCQLAFERAGLEPRSLRGVFPRCGETICRPF